MRWPSMRAPDRRHLLPGVAAFTGVLLVALLGFNAGADQPPSPTQKRVVELQLLGVNDFHGHLEPPEPGIGGAAWLGAHLERAARSHPGRTITVHAGDMIGASPLVSSHFQDEPAIEATNLMGFDVGAVGNHEFDEGGAELMRVLEGSRYQWLAANTVDAASGVTLLPPYRVIERAGVRVGFIGVTTDDTPTWLLPEFKSNYRFLDISDAVNRWVPELRARGVEAIVVLAHSGAFQKGKSAVGEIADETAQMDDSVDVVVAGHTHSQLNFRVGDKLVVESLAYGTGFDRVRIGVDRVTGEVVRKRAELPATTHAGIAPHEQLARLVAGYAERVNPIGDQVVGELEQDLDSDELSRLVADAQRSFAGADVAFVNPGNTRRPGMEAGEVTYAEAFLVHAYEHPIVRMRMSGSDVLAAWRQRGALELFQSGLENVSPEGTYSVAVNAVLAAAPRFGAFGRGTKAERIGTDLEALVAWLGRRSDGELAR
jgi:5'-nucleotidase